jgi:hypothetical protein
MTIQEVADLLNGIEYGREDDVFDRELCRKLREEGIVVVFGYSDDLVEFHGAISDQLGAYEHYFDSNGMIRNECDCEDCPYFAKMIKHFYVKPRWCETDEYCWTYDTNIPHVTFDVLEDGDKYCRGIVFQLSNLTTMESRL